MKAAAIYARVSSDKQKEEHTIASQTAALRAFAQEQQCDVPAEWVFEDEGYSGASLVRPGLERVRDLAAEGLIEAVLVYAPDRLSRRYAHQVLLIEEFARVGVETLFVRSPRATTPEDQLLLQFQGMIAEYERAQILERSRRGKRHRAQQGQVNVLSGVPELRCATADLVGKVPPEFLRPAPDSFMADHNSTPSQQVFDHPQAEWKPKIEPDGVSDDLSRER